MYFWCASSNDFDRCAYQQIQIQNVSFTGSKPMWLYLLLLLMMVLMMMMMAKLKTFKPNTSNVV